MSNDKEFKLEELSKLSGISSRNIRYYIQLSLVDRPIGNRRSAIYNTNHLDQLLTIKKWQKAGLSLERIKEILTEEDVEIPLPKNKPGSISINSHIHLAKGVDLVVDSSMCKLTSTQLRALSKKVIEHLENISKESNNG